MTKATSIHDSCRCRRKSQTSYPFTTLISFSIKTIILSTFLSMCEWIVNFNIILKDAFCFHHTSFCETSCSYSKEWGVEWNQSCDIDEMMNFWMCLKVNVSISCQKTAHWMWKKNCMTVSRFYILKNPSHE